MTHLIIRISVKHPRRAGFPCQSCFSVHGNRRGFVLWKCIWLKLNLTLSLIHWLFLRKCQNCLAREASQDGFPSQKPDMNSNHRIWIVNVILISSPLLGSAVIYPGQKQPFQWLLHKKTSIWVSSAENGSLEIPESHFLKKPLCLTPNIWYFYNSFFFQVAGNAWLFLNSHHNFIKICLSIPCISDAACKTQW